MKEQLTQEMANNLVNQGKWNELAKGVFEELKTRELSPEALEKLIPLSTNFVAEMISVIKAEIDNDKEAYKNYTDAMNSIISAFKETLKVGKIDKGERSEISNKLIQLAQIMADVEKHRNSEANKIKKWYAIVAAACVSIVVIFSGRKR